MRTISLATKVFIGFIIGIALGLIFKESILIIKPIGDIFLNLIRMLVAPLIFFSIASSVSGLESMTQLRRMGGKVMLYYAGTTVISAVIGLVCAHIIAPGAGFSLDALAGASTAPAAPATQPGVAAAIISMVPTNPFKALADGNLIQIIIFAVFIGTAVTSLGGKTETFKKFIDDGANIMYRVTAMVMEVSPYGVCALIAVSIGQYGLHVFGPLGKLVGGLYLAALCIILVLYVPMLKFIGKMPLSVFFRHIGKVMVMTASTTSSAGTMPLTMKTATEDFKVHKELVDFAIPLGTVINMNGAVLFYSMCMLFVAQIYGVEVPISQQIFLVFFASIIAMGSPGIPGGGIVMTMVLLNFMGLPLEIMGLIAGVYRLFDICNTTLNVVGDVVTTICVGRTENMTAYPTGTESQRI